MPRTARGAHGSRGGQEPFGDDGDLGAVGTPGTPSPVVSSLDAEPVVDLGVVALAEQGRVLQRGVAVVGEPFEDVVDVAPVAGGVAPGEDAVAIPDFHRPAQVRGHDPVGATQVQQLPVRAHDHAADDAVAGKPAGAGGGDHRAEPGAAGSGPGVLIDEVVQVDEYGHVWLHRAHRGQVAGGQRVVGELDECVGLLLGAAAGVPGGAGGL